MTLSDDQQKFLMQHMEIALEFYDFRLWELLKLCHKPQMEVEISLSHLFFFIASKIFSVPIVLV